MDYLAQFVRDHYLRLEEIEQTPMTGPGFDVAAHITHTRTLTLDRRERTLKALRREIETRGQRCLDSSSHSPVRSFCATASHSGAGSGSKGTTTTTSRQSTVRAGSRSIARTLRRFALTPTASVVRSNRRTVRPSWRR